MEMLRKLTTLAAIVGAATFSGVYLTGCDEGYEAENIEGVEGVEEMGEDVGEGLEDAGEEIGEGVEDVGNGLQ